MPSCPSVSVLMPCLNPGPYLNEAIASCLAQHELLQLLVADGGSEAATLDCLRGWAERDARVVWWSEADQGPADALSRALHRSEAELIGWLNADDRYEPGCLRRAAQALEQTPGWQMVYGHGQHISEAGDFLELYPSREPGAGLAAFQDGCFICQPTVLIRRGFLDQLGGFDARWRVCFDLDLWLRAFSAAPESIGFVPALQASTRLHPSTITSRQQWRVHLESAALLQRRCSSAADHWIHAAVRQLLARHPPERATALLDQELLALAEPELAERFRAALLGLLRSEEPPQIINLPGDLMRLLCSRPDLLACGFHRSSQEQGFVQWLVLHGIHEYPALVEGDATSNPVLAWLAQPPVSARLPRIAAAIWNSTARHRRRWPQPRRAASYQRWLRSNWLKLPQQPLPTYAALFGISRRKRILQRVFASIKTPSAGTESPLLSAGVNLIGYERHALGIGEDLRTTALALQSANVPTANIDFPPRDFPGRELAGALPPLASRAPHRTTVICLTAEETTRYVLSCGRSMLDSRYVIGYWPWELPLWPEPWGQAIEIVDEIWVSSRHIQAALHGKTSKPVELMPLCVDAGFLELKDLSDEQRRHQRETLALPDSAVLMLCSFDLSSYSQRKNPWGAIQTFQRAFPPALVGGNREDVVLVVKTFPPAHPHPDWERLKRVAELDPRIHIIEANLSRCELSALYSSCDVLLSLHRAEGFGRVLAEALQLGLDVIATDWSGNTDFCRGPLAHPVPYTLVPVAPGAYPHGKNQHWAEPDLAAAAATLQQVVLSRLRDGRPDRRLVAPYRQQFSAVSCGQRYRLRLEQLGLLSGSGAHPGGWRGSSPPPPG